MAIGESPKQTVHKEVVELSPNEARLIKRLRHIAQTTGEWTIVLSGQGLGKRFKLREVGNVERL